MTSKNNSDFYCLNCLHSFRTTNILELHKKVRDNRDFCNVVMLSEDTTVNQYRKNWQNTNHYLCWLSIKDIENKHDVCKDEDCMKNFVGSLRKHAVKIIKFKNKKWNYWQKQKQESCENAKICYICKESLKINMQEIKNIVRLDTIVIIQVNTEVLHIVHVIWNLVYLNKMSFPQWT